MVSCDRCTSVFCQDCASLTTTEMRSVALKKRIVIFLCTECRASYEKFTTSKVLDASLNTQFAVEIKDIVHKVVSELLPSILQQVLGDRISANDSKINEVKVAVENLRDTNVDLIKLFDQGQPPKVHAPPNQSSYRRVNKQLSLEVGGSSKRLEANRISNMQPKTPISPPDPLNLGPPAVPVSVEKPTAKKKKESVSVIGTRKDFRADHSAFSSVERRQWLYIGRASPETTEDDILNYAKKTLEVEDVRCHLLTANEDSSSFKLGVRESVLRNLLNPALWPQGIAVREFLPRSRNKTSGNFREEPSANPRH